MADDLRRLLRRTARAAEDRGLLLAAVFARYRAAEGVDDMEMARRLGVTPDRLDEIAICRRPRPDRFRDDVATIAARFSADPAALAGIIRLVDALDAFAATTPRNFLAAARDAEDKDGEE
jgi:hypothetical protein